MNRIHLHVRPICLPLHYDFEEQKQVTEVMVIGRGHRRAWSRWFATLGIYQISGSEQ